MTKQPLSSFSEQLLAWYDHQARVLPWRVPPSLSQHQAADPYAVWLSESMLQQTTVKSVIAYFQKFLTLWPTVQDLAAADRDDVLTAWAGLGYYARARNLHACAKMVVEDYDGKFPSQEAELRKLAGIGAYTAAAIASIAFNNRAVVVDGNVERIMSRYFAVEAVLPAGKPIIYKHTDSVTPQNRTGDFAQAMMDLGATVCTPRNPQCLLCPVQQGCEASAHGTMTEYPRKAPKKARPTRRAWVFLLEDQQDGTIFIQQRPDDGLLGGLWEFPSTPWNEEALETALIPTVIEKTFSFPIQGFQILETPPVKHTFTHFDLFLSPVIVKTQKGQDNWSRWVSESDLQRYALPTLMKKVWKVYADSLKYV